MVLSKRVLNFRLPQRSTTLNKRVDPQSHTTYKWLSSEEKQQCMQALHAKVRALSNKNEQNIYSQQSAASLLTRTPTMIY